MNTVKNIKKQQVVCGIIIEINQVILFLLSDSEFLKYKTSNTANTYNVGNNEERYDANKVGKKETEVVIPLEHLSNFWRTLDIPLINCEVELILSWTKNCVLADMTVANNPPTELEFQITDTKFYVPVVTLSKKKRT